MSESKGLLEEATAKIKDVFILMQDRFKNAEKRQPISLIDAMAFTNQGHSEVMAVLGDLERQLRQLWKERPQLNIFQEAFNAESLLSQYEEYHKAVVSWVLKVEKRVFGEG